MKKCTKCGEWKPISEFYKKKRGKYGVDSTCKECKKKYDKEYYNNNKERIQEKTKEYYSNNKERKQEYIKNYYKNVNNSKRTAIRNSLNSHKKKYDVIITLDECLEMDNEYCFYCGCKLEWEYGTGHSNYSPTIDRINNENILTKDNIVFACIACNAGKHSGTIEEYIERCKRVVANENNILGDN